MESFSKLIIICKNNYYNCGTCLILGRWNTGTKMTNGNRKDPKCLEIIMTVAFVKAPVLKWVMKDI